VVSAALTQWRTGRAARLSNLLGAHVAVGGSQAGRRWATEELNHAIVLRLASEFQGFCRDLHDEAVGVLVGAVARNDPGLQRVLTVPYHANRKLDRGNAEPGALGIDFGLLGMTLWPDLKAGYPAKGPEWSRKLGLLNEARNGIAHDDTSKITKVQLAGWPLTMPSIKKWRSALDGLAGGMDHVTCDYLRKLLKVTPW